MRESLFAVAIRQRGEGTKQGTLLLRDRAIKTLSLFTGKGLPGGVDNATLERLAGIQNKPPAAPCIDDAGVPPSEGWQPFPPPYENGCCLRIGPLRGAARAIREPDALIAGAVGYGNQYSWTMPGAQIVFACEREGSIEWEARFLVSARALVEHRGGKAAAKLGVWAARCRPKERGEFHERTFWQAENVSADESLADLAITHAGSFPCTAGDSLEIGVGVTAAAAATGNSYASLVATARIAHVRLRCRP